MKKPTKAETEQKKAEMEAEGMYVLYNRTNKTLALSKTRRNTGDVLCVGRIKKAEMNGKPVSYWLEKTQEKVS